MLSVQKINKLLMSDTIAMMVYPPTDYRFVKQELYFNFNITFPYQ